MFRSSIIINRISCFRASKSLRFISTSQASLRKMTEKRERPKWTLPDDNAAKLKLNNSLTREKVWKFEMSDFSKQYHTVSPDKKNLIKQR